MGWCFLLRLISAYWFGNLLALFRLSSLLLSTTCSPFSLNLLTNTERVDTRVLQVIYAVQGSRAPLYVGQQVDVYVEGNP